MTSSRTNALGIAATLGLCLTVLVLPAAAETQCNTAGTGEEMNVCAANDLAKAEKELNAVYQALLKKEAKNTVFIQKLRNAQRAWVAFRDADLDATYACADESPFVCWGSMLPLCEASYKEKVTRERTERLRRLLNEGRPADDCH